MAATVHRLPTTINQRLRHIIGNSFGADVVEQNLEKALQQSREKLAAPTSSFYDPISLFMGREWLQRRNIALSYGDLRNMARNPIIGSIINTRISQVASYCVPQLTAYDYGYKVETSDPEAAKDVETSTMIRDWLCSAGEEGYGEQYLEIFARKYIRDSLVMDQATAEIVYRRNGKPAYLVAIDGATIRKLKAALNYAVPPDPKTPLYVQVIEDVIVTQYTEDQMMLMIRHPQTELPFVGYGLPELEILMRTVTTIINTDRFNSGQLAQGGTNKGILVVKGDGIEKYQMDSFKRDFREAVRNAASFWRPPVLHVAKDADIQWIALDRSNRDMEYAALFDFLVKQACGVFSIDPQEINWQIGPSAARMNFESGIGPKIRASQIKGLKPILTGFANMLNLKVVRKLDPRFSVRFVGLLEERAEDSLIRQREVTSYKTINEVRVELNLPALEGGDIVLNPVYLTNMQNPQGLPPVDADVASRRGTRETGSLVKIEEELGVDPT